MSKQPSFDLHFKFEELGEEVVHINGVPHDFKFEVCIHGARISTTATIVVELGGENLQQTRTVYFGEGNWLALPTIEEAVLEILDGTVDDVEVLTTKYDEFLAVGIDVLLLKGENRGFIADEIERLKNTNDL